MIKFSAYCRVCLLLGLLCALSSCEKDDDKSDKAVNQWIDATMRSWYLWYSDIPDKKQLNFNAEPETFFRSLLSKEDGKNNPQVSGGHYYYSTIKKKTASTATRSYMGGEPALGFEFQNWQLDNTGTKFAANVLYVLPGSPAEKKGLKRGDWIHKINGTWTNNSNIYDLLGDKTVVLAVSDGWNNPVTHSMELVPALIEDNPVLLTEVYQDESTGNKKVGYMVYNHFTSGPDGDKDTTYDKQLRQRFAEFKAEGVEEFILDLRYNGGGLVTSAQLLAELLAPKSALGEIFCNLKYNDKQDKTVTYRLDKTDENLDLPRLFILTGSRTASASEAVINGLRPFYKVYLLGEQTEGKNVGSITLTSDKYDYELHPIVCKISNAEGNSEYKDGFIPDWKLEGNDRMILGHIELGDKDNDKLLNVAVGMISGRATTMTKDIRSSSVSFNAIPGYSSLDRKAMNGVQIPFTSEDVEW